MLNLDRTPKTLYLVRGLPGRGKSTLARQLTRHNVAADDYPGLYSADGTYNLAQQQASHDWCLNRAIALMEKGKHRVAVHNTFTKAEYLAPYIGAALRLGYSVQVIHVEGTWVTGGMTTTLHGVPEAVVQRMANGWQAMDPTLACVPYSSQPQNSP